MFLTLKINNRNTFYNKYNTILLYIVLLIKQLKQQTNKKLQLRLIKVLQIVLTAKIVVETDVTVKLLLLFEAIEAMLTIGGVGGNPIEPDVEIV